MAFLQKLQNSLVRLPIQGTDLDLLTTGMAQIILGLDHPRSTSNWKPVSDEGHEEILATQIASEGGLGLTQGAGRTSMCTPTTRSHTDLPMSVLNVVTKYTTKTLSVTPAKMPHIRGKLQNIWPVVVMEIGEVVEMATNKFLSI